MVTILAKFVCLFLTITSIRCQADSSFYITFNYNVQVTPQPYSDDYRQIQLPCTARILTCAYQFSLLPPNWIGENSRILVPIEDILSVATYSVQLTASELTGQTLDLSLILEMTNGKVKVYDRQQFFKKKNFNTTAPTVQQKDRDLATAQRKRLPSIISIQQIISSGDYFKITSIVSDIINQDVGCQLKIDYLGEVLNLLYTEIAKVQGDIKVSGAQIDIKIKQIMILEEQIANLKIQLDPQIRMKEIKDKITSLNASRTGIYFNYNRYNIISNSYLSKIKAALKDSDSANDQSFNDQIAMKEKKLEETDEKIKQLVSKKKDLELKIAVKKLRAVASQTNQNSAFLETLQKQYREYSELAIQQKVQFQRLDYEISALANSLNAKTNSLTSLDSQIGKIDQRIASLKDSGQANELEKLSNLNQILKNNVLTIQGRIDSLQNQCG